MGLASTGTRWAIATPHEAATEAGGRAFEAGGNAIDAALAAAVTLAVTYPHNCGVGGDLFALVERAGHDGGDTLAVRSSGRAPNGADAAAIRARHGTQMPIRGPDPITVPGAVAGWEALHHVGARLPWGAHFETAIAAAADGSPMPATLGAWLADPSVAAELGAHPALAAVFFPGGRAIAAGEPLVQPALARTLEAIAAGGAEALYRGPVGAAYVEGLRAAGSPISIDDLAAHEAVVLPPIGAAWRDLHVQVAPPTSQGYALLLILGAAARLGIDPDPCGADASTWARIFLVAEHDVRRHLGDPDRMRVHVSTLLDDGHLAAFCDEVRGETEPTVARGRPRGDTIALVTADAEGHAVSLIQSLFHGFGSGILEPTTGIVAHDRGACFTLGEDEPGTFAPGALPPHTLMPALVHRRGDLVGVAGTMGGYQQPQIIAQTLVGSFALDRTPAEAVAAPRFVVDDLEDPDVAPPVAAQRSIPAATIDALERSGHAVYRIDDLDDWVGHAQLIRVGPEGFTAGSDPRADGAALAG
jgi:gamma-glutamyltranspeptidase/glutathione hydrolase